jgi:hypothetical protein
MINPKNKFYIFQPYNVKIYNNLLTSMYNFFNFVAYFVHKNYYLDLLIYKTFIHLFNCFQNERINDSVSRGSLHER